jgi:hypothetical protein
MWLIPYTPGSRHLVTITLPKVMTVAGFRVWNYNKGVPNSGAWEEDTLRGVRRVTIFADDASNGRGPSSSGLQPIGEFVLRMGPGCDGVDYGQTVLFRNVRCPSMTNCPGIAHPASTPAGARQAVYYSPACKQDYETPYMPSGLLWRFVLHENWNDGYYIGLDGLVFLDAQGRPIDVLGVSSGAGAEVHAVPHSLRDLADAHARSAEGSAAADPNDPRTPDKLFADPQGNNFVGWLAPLSRCMSTEERSQCAARLHSRNASTSRLQEEENAGHKFPLDNTVLVCFQYPVSISGIIIKNYSKTPARGVK